MLYELTMLAIVLYCWPVLLVVQNVNFGYRQSNARGLQTSEMKYRIES